MKRLFLSLLLLPSLALASAIRSQQTGDWGTGSTWVGGVAPGTGIPSPFITLSRFRIRGLSERRLLLGRWSATASSARNNPYCKRQLLGMRGDVTYTADTANTTDTVNIDGGGIWELIRLSHPVQRSRNMRFIRTATSGWRAFKAVGTAGSRAILRTNSSSGMGALRMNGWAYGGGYTLAYSGITNIEL